MGVLSNCRTQVLKVESYARIHLGLLQMSAGFRFLNMGIGFSVQAPRWVFHVKATEGQHSHVESACNEMPSMLLLDQGHVLLEKLTKTHGVPPLAVTIKECIPEHIGLGSKTAFLCGLLAAGSGAVGVLDAWIGWRSMTGRGGTSGIGVNAAVTGGFVLDSGHREDYSTGVFAPSRSREGCPLPQCIGRWEMPHWQLILVYPVRARRFFGEAEQRFFHKTLPLKKDEVEHVAAISLYELFPAVTTGDYESFVRALSRLQNAGFKAREWVNQDSTVHRVRDAALEAGAECVALSSMGPTLAIFARDPATVLAHIQQLPFSDLKAIQTTVRNKGIDAHTIHCSREQSLKEPKGSESIDTDR